MKKGKIARFVTLALLVALLAAGCSFFGGGQSETFLQFNIGSELAARGIGVDYYDVEAVEIEVGSDCCGPVEWFRWEAWEGPQAYMLPVAEGGGYYIRVTHYGFNGFDGVEAYEEAWFEIMPMVITVIDVTPGMIGVIRINGEPAPPPPPPPCIAELEGRWFASNVDFSFIGFPEPVDILVSVTPDGTWELLFLAPGTQEVLEMSYRSHIYRCDGVIGIDTFESYLPPDEWCHTQNPDLEFEYEVSPAGDVFTGWVDFDMNGVVDAVIQLFRV